ncbi:MAG: heme-copper oxidase subunit III, partial [Actinomycetes bacterium]
MSDAVLELPAVSAPPRRRELLFGTAFASAGVVMVLITLVGAYLNARGAAGTNWLANNDVPLTQPNMMMFTLVMSTVTMQWAVWSIDRDDRGHTYLALGVTLLLGAAYVNQASFLFSQVQMTMGQLEGPYFYAVTGTHLAMVIAAMVFIVLMAFRALGGQFSSRQPDGIGAAAVFWHATVASFVVVWV